MKKIFVAMAATALVLGGCTKGEDVNPSNNEMATVRFAAAGNAGIELMTRTDNPNTYSGVIGVTHTSDGNTWEVAPQDLIFNNTALSTSSSIITIEKANESANVNLLNGNLQISASGKDEEKGFYSFGVAEGAVSVNNNVATIAHNGDATSPANDYIFAYKPTAAKSGEATTNVQFEYEHVMAKIKIRVCKQGVEGYMSSDKAVIATDIQNLNIALEGELDLIEYAKGTKPTPSATTDYLKKVEVNQEYYVLPQTIDKGKVFTVNCDGVDYTVTLPSNLELTKNHVRVITLTVAGTGIVFNATLQDWTTDDDDTDFEIPLTPKN